MVKKWKYPNIEEEARTLLDTAEHDMHVSRADDIGYFMRKEVNYRKKYVWKGLSETQIKEIRKLAYKMHKGTNEFGGVF